MNNDTHTKSQVKQHSPTADEITQHAEAKIKDFADSMDEAAGSAVETVRNSAQSASRKGKEIFQSVKQKAEESLTTSKDYVRRNPVPVVLGAVVCGATLGCLVMMMRRKPTFGERYAEEPLLAMRDAMVGALAPVTHRVHRGYDSALGGAGRAIKRMHHCSSGACRNSLSDRIARIGGTLKFW